MEEAALLPRPVTDLLQPMHAARLVQYGFSNKAYTSEETIKPTQQSIVPYTVQ